MSSSHGFSGATQSAHRRGGDYNPNSIGTRPAYGWYIHRANGVSFTNSSVKFSANDNRPAVIANTGSAISFDHFVVQRGSGSPYDLGFQSVTGYCQTSVTNTSGGAPRVSATDSSQSSSCGGGLTISGLSVADSANAGDWSVQSDLRAGNTLLGDRTFTVASVPPALPGAQCIRTAILRVPRGTPAPDAGPSNGDPARHQDSRGDARPLGFSAAETSRAA